MKPKALVLIILCLSLCGSTGFQPVHHHSSKATRIAWQDASYSWGLGRGATGAYSLTEPAAKEPAAKEASWPGTSNLAAVLSGLEKKMSPIKTLQTSFIQEKNLAVFDQKLTLKGTIFIQKPNLFAWHVNEPVRYSLIIKGNSVIQWDEDTKQIQHISLSKNTGYKIITQQLKEWLSGAYTSMLEQYDITVLKSAPVCLKFAPRQSTMVAKAITSVTVTFDQDERYIQKISIEEKNGDSTILTFTDTQLNIPIDAPAWRVK